MGARAERTQRISCATCGHAFEVTLKATGSASGLAENKDDPELQARAQRVAAENLARMTAMDACPACGAYQEDQLQRIFRDAAHAALRRRYDDVPGAPASFYARARRLAARGTSVEEMRAALGPPPVPDASDLLDALGKDPVFAERAGGAPALYASLSEGDRLARWLSARGVTGEERVARLCALYGVDADVAASILGRIAAERNKREGSLGLFLGAIALLFIGGLAALLFGVVIPFARSALAPKTEPDAPFAWRPAVPVPHVPREERLRGGEPARVPSTPATPAARPVSPQGTYAALDGTGLALSITPTKDTLTLSLEQGPGDSFGKVLLNGAEAKHATYGGDGERPKITLDEVTERHPGLAAPGEVRRVSVIAEVFYEAPNGAPERRVLKAEFLVHVPAAGQTLAATDVVSIAPEEDASQALEAKMGADAVGAIDRVLFGTPHPPATPTAAPLGAMDRDIRRAELKERAFHFMEALLESDDARALAFTAPEDRDRERTALAGLRRDASIADGKVLEAAVDETGTTGTAKITYTLDRDEGSLVRTGAASFRYENGAWLFDP